MVEVFKALRGPRYCYGERCFFTDFWEPVSTSPFLREKYESICFSKKKQTTNIPVNAAEDCIKKVVIETDKLMPLKEKEKIDFGWEHLKILERVEIKVNLEKEISKIDYECLKNFIESLPPNVTTCNIIFLSGANKIPDDFADICFPKNVKNLEIVTDDICEKIDFGNFFDKLPIGLKTIMLKLNTHDDDNVPEMHNLPPTLKNIVFCKHHDGDKILKKITIPVSLKKIVIHGKTIIWSA